MVDLGAATGSGGDAAGDTLSSIENLIGSNLGDTLTGDANNNRIEGAGGADIMDGGSGQDLYVYNSFSDSVEGQMDSISGFEWGTGGDLIDCSAIRRTITLDVTYFTTDFSDFGAVKAES